MLLALLHSNGQLRTERDGDTEKGCQKPAVQQKTTDDDCGGRRVFFSTAFSGRKWSLTLSNFGCVHAEEAELFCVCFRAVDETRRQRNVARRRCLCSRTVRRRSSLGSRQVFSTLHCDGVT